MLQSKLNLNPAQYFSETLDLDKDAKYSHIRLSPPDVYTPKLIVWHSSAKIFNHVIRPPAAKSNAKSHNKFPSCSGCIYAKLWGTCKHSGCQGATFCGPSADFSVSGSDQAASPGVLPPLSPLHLLLHCRCLLLSQRWFTVPLFFSSFLQSGTAVVTG